jgi:YjjG family noncanonical pyrimidine nucleotidase
VKYDWIFFDADGTLFDYETAEAAALQGAFEACDLPFEASIGSLYSEINAAIWREFELGEVSQAELKTKRFDRLFEAVGLEIDSAAFSASYLEILAAQTILLDGAEDVLDRLAGRVEMVLLTNGLAEVQQPRFSASTIRHFFSEIVISGEIGLAKPDPAIYDHAFNLIGDPPRHRVLMVGDNLGSDILGGANAGIDTCWYNPTGAANGHGVEPDYEIRRLDELIDLVGEPL